MKLDGRDGARSGNAYSTSGQRTVQPTIKQVAYLEDLLYKSLHEARYLYDKGNFKDYQRAELGNLIHSLHATIDLIHGLRRSYMASFNDEC